MTTHRSNSARSGPPNEPPRPAANRPTPRWLHWLWIVGVVATLLLLFAPAPTSPKTRSLSFTGWKAKVDADQVTSATIDPDGKVTGRLDDKARTPYESRIPTALNDTTIAADLEQHGVTVKGTGASTSFLSVLVGFLPLIVLVGLFFWFSRNASRQLGGVMGIGASRAKVYDEERPKTRFGDVAGYEGAKREISEVVEFLKHPTRYAAAGAVGPRGVLMVGPPGTGKTLLARAVAGEAEVPFFALTGSSFVELFVGVGAARVRDLFTAARKAAPAIVFIDEVDAIGQRRGGALVQNDEREQTLNQLLNELDGFDPTAGVVVLAATNRPETLDPALLRPGRFDRQVEIPLPNVRERAAILAVHADGKRFAPDVDLGAVARGTPGFSGADLANLINEAAIVAVRAGRATITGADFSDARDRILLGRREATNALLPDEKRVVAVLESGHALVAALVAERRPGGTGHDPAGGPVARCDRAAAGGRAAPLFGELPQGLARGPARRTGGRAPRARRGVLGRRERSGRRDRSRGADGPRVRDERATRARRVRERLADVSRHRGGAQSRLRRRHAEGHRRRGRRPPARGRTNGDRPPRRPSCGARSARRRPGRPRDPRRRRGPGRADRRRRSDRSGRQSRTRHPSSQTASTS